METKICRKQFTAGGKTVSVYAGALADVPVVYLNTFAEEGDGVYRLLCGRGCPDFMLVTVSGLTWNHDMAPWEIPPAVKDGAPCTGGADAYLDLLTGEIILRAEELLQGNVLWRGLAGYSLAGLFALYSTYRSRFFSRIASVSGSLWFPGLMEYVHSHQMEREPEYMYFSLGDRECRTANPGLKTVQENTEKIAAYYRERGIGTTFQLNKGGHCKNADRRTAAGIQWLLDQPPRNGFTENGYGRR